MELTVYLTFAGESEAAIERYSQIFDGKVNILTRYAEAPFETPADYKRKIMFAELELKGIKLLISDIAPGRYELQQGNQVALMLNFESKSEAKQVFNGLADGGIIIEPLEDTFWGTTFGMLTDKFGITWKLSSPQR